MPLFTRHAPDSPRMFFNMRIIGAMRQPMLPLLAIAFSAWLSVPTMAADKQATPNAPKPIEIMVLGAYHMGNPGLDLNNVKVDSVLTPVKQAEIADVVNRLARFKPTKIAVESVADRPGFVASAYEAFSAAQLLKEPNEIHQIGFRLANQLGHKQVYGVDEQSDSIDYFPFDKVEAFAKTSPKHQAHLDAFRAVGAAMAKQMERDLKVKTVRQMLMSLNTAQYGQNEMRQFYWPLNRIGDEKVQPGAELNALWLMRNTKIMAKILQIGEPGDRILVMFGAGHSYWLRQMIANTPGLNLVEPNVYLK